MVQMPLNSLQADHCPAKRVKRHDAFVIRRPQAAEKVLCNGKEWDMLNIGIVFGMIRDNCVSKRWGVFNAR